MISKSPLLFILLLGYFGYAIGGDTPTEDDVSTAGDALAGNIEAGEARYKKAGEARYKKSCVNCHGAAGKGAASYPKVSGNDIPYTISKLETYREGTKIGPS